jgi:hypothetical protein
LEFAKDSKADRFQKPLGTGAPPKGRLKRAADMKRWLTHLTISAYLGVLTWGVFSHTVGYKNMSHPGMYFIVWDMFCGWAAYEHRVHIVGEGESGAYYDLAPGPWGEFRPFGRLGRHNYDSFGSHAARQALNCLKHTDHEPILRIYLVEECWPKKFNLPDEVWYQQYEEPKEKYSYFHVRAVIAPDGATLQASQTFLAHQQIAMVYDNPRLQQDARRDRPFFTYDYRNQIRGGLEGHEQPYLLTAPSAH